MADTPEIKTKCDLLLVSAAGKTYLVEADEGLAQVGDRVDFIPRGEDLVSGYVDDIMTTEPFSSDYCFVTRLAHLQLPIAVYHKVWVNRNLCGELD